MVLPTTWHDGLEILFFSSLFYYLSLWLRKDRQQNLLWYFYGYSAITLLAYNAHLPTVSLFLLIFSPAIIMLFIMVHQNILQRNFVALRHITPAQTTTHDWLEGLIQTCLIVINNNKSITCIIERSDNMHTFLQVPFIIHAPLHTALLDVLINSDSYDQHKMVWIDAHGNLEGINASWRHAITQNSIQEDTTQLHDKARLEKTRFEKARLEKARFEKIASDEILFDDALLYTTKTDALLFTINPATRTFTIIMQGNQLQKISAHHAYTTIQKYLTSMHHTQQKGTFHVTNTKNHTDQKYTS